MQSLKCVFNSEEALMSWLSTGQMTVEKWPCNIDAPWISGIAMLFPAPVHSGMPWFISDQWVHHGTPRYPVSQQWATLPDKWASVFIPVFMCWPVFTWLKIKNVYNANILLVRCEIVFCCLFFQIDHVYMYISTVMNISLLVNGDDKNSSAAAWCMWIIKSS